VYTAEKKAIDLVLNAARVAGAVCIKRAGKCTHVRLSNRFFLNYQSNRLSSATVSNAYYTRVYYGTSHTE